MNEKIWEVSDIYLAAAARTLGHPLVGLRKVGTKGIFQFKDFPGREQFIQGYFNGTLTGSLKQFSTHWSDLKALVACAS